MSPLQVNQASQANLNSEDTFRIKRPLESPGDIFEFDVSTQAIFLGPESDVNEVVVEHYDPTLPSRVQSFLVTPERPLLGRTDALLDRTLAGSNIQPRIIAYSRALFDDLFITDVPATPRGDFTPEPDIQLHLPVNIDLIAYTENPPAAPDMRSTFKYQSAVRIADTGDGSGIGRTFFYFPAFGRRFIDIKVRNNVGPNQDFVLWVVGQSLQRQFVFGTKPTNASTFALAGPVAVANPPVGQNGVVTRQGFDATVSGFFDFITVVIEMNPNGAGDPPPLDPATDLLLLTVEMRDG